MKRVLLLTLCFLIFPRWSIAQIGCFPGMKQYSSYAVKPGESPASGADANVVTLPAGTHMLMKLTSPLHTTSSTPGAGIYLETLFPVIADSREAIPEHTRVFGLVDSEKRPGRVHGRARIHLRFTQLILPDNRELAIVGDLQSLPGSSENRTDKQGALEPVDQIDADVYTVATATGVGVLFGSISHVGLGVPVGAAIGGGLGLAKVLFTRGDEISLPAGTRVEMVLQRPLTLKPLH
jgi:hypothetical protein